MATLKKNELKNIIKECIREIIFEENFLSPIISEIATGISGQQRLNEVPIQYADTKRNIATNYKELEEKKKKIMYEIGGNLNGVNVFDGITSSKLNEDTGAGINLDKIPGLGNSAEIMRRLGNK